MFVIVINGVGTGTWSDFNELKKFDYHYKKKEYKYFYGAIWTEWGLKYVAKMNENGELKLI